MIKDESTSKENPELLEDIQFMLSSIRARQNTLIFYLQRYRNCLGRGSTEFKLAKNQFQQKQKIYSRQISTILQKHSQFSYGSLQQVVQVQRSAVRAFWIKLKTIIKVSMERIATIGLPVIDKLNQCYEKALTACARNSDSQKALSAYRQIQNAFKKRTIEALLLSKEHHSPSSVSYSESKIEKNRSETLFKPQNAITRFTIQNQDSYDFKKGETFGIVSKDKIPRQPYLNGLAFIKQENASLNQPKIKSLNRIKNRKPDQTIKSNLLNFIKIQQLGKIKSSSKASEKYIKKINKHVQKYEKNFDGAFDGKYQITTLLDKKKTIFQNIYSLYDDLFAKNIPNHKMIAKFMFNTTKINQILYNAYEKKKKNQKKKEKDKDKEKEKDKDKDKQRPKVDKELKEMNAGQKKHKEKEKEKEKQIDEKQRPGGIKSSKANRKINWPKDHPNQIQKKESEMTAITSKNHTNHKQGSEKHEKGEKDKQKKIHKSKTGKIKLNSQIHNPQLQVLSNNFLAGKHFISQQQGHKIASRGPTEKLVKTILD